MTSNAPAPILVVDDDDDVRGSLVSILAFEGFQAQEAGDGAEALERLASGPRPRLIVLDWNMPGMDGATFLGRLQQDAELSAIPVVVTTGARSIDSVPGATRILQKPLDCDHLIDAIREHCREIPQS